MLDNFDTDELLLLIEVLHRSIDRELEIAEGYASEDETGIKCNLTVQSVVCAMFTNIADSIRLLEKLTQAKALKLRHFDLEPSIKDFKAYLNELNAEVFKIQTNTDTSKSDLN